jgi:hypothetical protein
MCGWNGARTGGAHELDGGGTHADPAALGRRHGPIAPALHQLLPAGRQLEADAGVGGTDPGRVQHPAAVRDDARTIEAEGQGEVQTFIVSGFVDGRRASARYLQGQLWCSADVAERADDLRHRRRPGGAGRGAAGALPQALGRGGHPTGHARAILRAGRHPHRVPQGSSAYRDLRSARPRPGPTHLAHRRALMPQHAHVLHARGPDPDPREPALRTAAVRLPGPGPIGGPGHADCAVHAVRPEAAGVPDQRVR